MTQVHVPAAVRARPFPSIFCVPDPLAGDLASDAFAVVSTRSLRRLAMVAAEAGARFAGGEGAGRAMEWMSRPRALFDGSCAMEACLDLRHALRAVAVHGLGLDPDCEASDVDSMMAPADEDAVGTPSDRLRPRSGGGLGASRLFVLEIVREADGASVWAFGATVAGSEAAVRLSLRTRYGADVAASAEVREGFDRGVGLARSLVSPALAETLEAVAADPRSPIARGFEVLIEQRFHA